MVEFMSDAAEAKNPPPPRQPVRGLERIYMACIIGTVVVLGLYFGRPVLVPLALATLLAFALGPVVGLLRTLHLGHALSVLLSVLFAVVILGAVTTFIGVQFSKLTVQLPRYQTNIVHKIETIRGTATESGLVQRVSWIFRSVSNEILGKHNSNQGVTPLAVSGSSSAQPIPVEIHEPDPGPLQIIKNVVGPLLEPLAAAAIIIVFVAFILLQKEDLRDRFIRLAGSRDLQRTTIALDDAARRLSRYLLVQTIINTIFGVLIAIGLGAIGVPTPGLWGLLAAMLRFVPYVGVPLASTLPLALAFAVDPGWGMVIWTLVLYFTLEPIVGQVIEPWVYGRNMGLSAVAVVVSAAFWTLLWGPVGLLLSTPLTMCLVVMGRHVEHLKFLDVMLGDKPPLTNEESFYLRLLSRDPDELADHAESALRDGTLAAYFDNVAVRALTLANEDAERGALDGPGLVRIERSIEGMLANLSHRDDEKSADDLPEKWRGERVLCVAGRGLLDRSATRLFTHLLTRRGIGTRIVSAEDASPDNIQYLDTKGIEIVCLSYLDADNYRNARFLVRRLRRKFPDAIPVAAFWNFPPDDSRYLDAVEQTECNLVVTSLGEGIEQIASIARSGTSARVAAK